MKRAIIKEFEQLGEMLSNYSGMLSYRLKNLCVKAEEVSLLPIQVLIDGEMQNLEKCTTIAKKDDYSFMIFPNFDEDISKRLKQSLTRQGIRIETSAQVTAVDHEGFVTFEKKGQKYEVVCDKVLMAVGRKPNVEGLNLDAVGITYNKKGIQVNENMQTNLPNIYAIGDVNGQLMLAHVATYQGYRAINHILGKVDKIRLDLVPAAVFTTPEVASVGLTEAQCEDEELDYRAIKVPFSSIGKAVAMGETDGFCKLIIDNEDRTILGCHIMGIHASDLIQEVVTMMNLNVTLDRAEDIIHVHPTLSEIIQTTIHS